MQDFNIHYPQTSSPVSVRAFALVAAIKAPWRYNPATEELIQRAAQLEQYLLNGAGTK